MTDRELLELAANAAGYTLDADGDRTDARDNYGAPVLWNPLADDGDALRLAVGLGIDFYMGADERGPEAWAGYYLPDKENKRHACESVGTDLYAATRRAIVRAAAEIGKGSK